MELIRITENLKAQGHSNSASIWRTAGCIDGNFQVQLECYYLQVNHYQECLPKKKKPQKEMQGLVALLEDVKPSTKIEEINLNTYNEDKREKCQ